MAQNDLINELRETVKETIEALKLPRLIPCTVTGESPLKVSVDQKLEITEKKLIIPDHIKDIKKGNKLVLLRDYGGDSYFVLGRV